MTLEKAIPLGIAASVVVLFAFAAKHSLDQRRLRDYVAKEEACHDLNHVLTDPTIDHEPPETTDDESAAMRWAARARRFRLKEDGVRMFLCMQVLDELAANR